MRDFSAVCGTQGNPRDYLSVLRSKGREEQRPVCGTHWDFLTIELCVGNSGNPFSLFFTISRVLPINLHVQLEGQGT